MNKTVLIVAAHTDDEALGCGGTIARHVAEGDVVHAVFIADGVSSRGNENREALSNRKKAAQLAHNILGIQEVYYLDFPDNRLDSVPLLDIIQPLESLIGRIHPHVIYSHHHGDLNIDHRITHQAIMTAARPVPGNTIREIYTFEIMSSTEWTVAVDSLFRPNRFVDISQYVDVKIAALHAYDLEMRDAPHSRSVEHLRILAEHRGYSVGVRAAEAFMVMRAVI